MLERRHIIRMAAKESKSTDTTSLNFGQKVEGMQRDQRQPRSDQTLHRGAANQFQMVSARRLTSDGPVEFPRT
jgi:hypothetical protein